MKPIEAETCESAWIVAMDHLLSQPEHEEHNLIVEISRPMTHTGEDVRVRGILDNFLSGHDAQPVVTVAETIFPAGEYRRRGVKGVYKTYPEEIYPLIVGPAEWGRYAYRLVRRRRKDGSVFNPLEETVNRLRAQVEGGKRMRACYELSVSDVGQDIPLFEPAEDSRRYRGGPCLSHISLKLGRDNRLYLTALYRLHYYVARALGNFLGLAMLQAFVCDQTGLTPGPLVCVSTLGRFDTDQWSLTEAREMLAQAKEAASRQAAKAPKGGIQK